MGTAGIFCDVHADVLHAVHLRPWVLARCSMTYVRNESNNQEVVVQQHDMLRANPAVTKEAQSIITAVTRIVVIPSPFSTAKLVLYYVMIFYQQFFV